MIKSTCKGCGKPIIFAMDDKGTRQILDPVAPVFAQFRQIVVRAPLSYVSHFATCPAADQQNKKCECGHGKGDHPDGACENRFCLCAGFHVRSMEEKP